MSEDKALLPCPFCGATPHRKLGKVQYDQLHGEPFQRAYVECPHDHATFNALSMDQAIAAWNHRAGHAAAQAEAEARVMEMVEAAYRRGYTEGAEDALEAGEVPHFDTQNEGWVEARAALGGRDADA